MPSNAFTDHLLVLLEDADELIDAHAQLRTGRQGRQWGLAALNRAVVVMCVSAWETFVEEVTLEAVIALRPPAGTPLGNWPTMNATARSLIGRFNNPNVDHVRQLIADTIGLADVTASWQWRNVASGRARELLTEALRFRHQIAHGVNPRPVIHHDYASWLPRCFLRLGRCTDQAIRAYLTATLGIPNPWPL